MGYASLEWSELNILIGRGRAVPPPGSLLTGPQQGSRRYIYKKHPNIYKKHPICKDWRVSKEPRHQGGA